MAVAAALTGAAQHFAVSGLQRLGKGLPPACRVRAAAGSASASASSSTSWVAARQGGGLELGKAGGPAERRGTASWRWRSVRLRLRVLSQEQEVPDYLPASWSAERRAKRPLGPALELSAEGAVLQQLAALRDNDSPSPDHGVVVMYRFAGFDPFERSTYFGTSLDLGQFERFRRLFHHSSYRCLLGHQAAEVLSLLHVAEGCTKVRVRVRGRRPGELEAYEFTMVQRTGGVWDGYWFTASLVHDGRGLSGGVAY